MPMISGPMAVDDAEAFNQSLRPARRGQLSYLQIPARNVQRSAEFLRARFLLAHRASASGIRCSRPHRPMGDRLGRRTANAGMLPWLHVDSMVDAMKLVRAHGGEVLEHPTPDGPDRLLATVRDPAGNVLGLVRSSPAGPRAISSDRKQRAAGRATCRCPQATHFSSARTGTVTRRMERYSPRGNWTVSGTSRDPPAMSHRRERFGASTFPRPVL